MKNNFLVVDYRIYDESCQKLEQMGYELIKLQSVNGFDEPVSAHPDMFMVNLCGKLFYDNNVCNYLKIKDASPLSRTNVREQYRYPFDIEFNCAPVGNNLICNKKHTNSEILRFAGDNGINIIDTKQGYSKCSVCTVSDSAIITEDNDIYNKCVKSAIDVLLVQKGFVQLNGYEYGFIGGCSGLIDNNKLVFNGNVNYHPDCKLIYEFCYNHGTEIINLCDKPLYDIGSIIQLQTGY